MNNKSTFERTRIVQDYAAATGLQPLEQAILDLLAAWLPGKSMLDIGVGAGRTTEHFAGRVQEYVGVDYAAPMINACKSRLTGKFAHATFEVCDASDMRRFEDSRFDFVLFSFNGIDYVDHQVRQDIFAEIRRVGRQDGFFCFSSHNIQSMDRLNRFSDCLSLNPLSSARQIRSWLLWKQRYRKTIDAEQLKTARYAVINDGAHDCGSDTYYVRPLAQIEDLSPWFSDVRVFALQDATELHGEQQLTASKDPWLYYLCRNS